MNSLPRISACCRTHPGKVRTHNEDICLAVDEAGCFLVADGMGGAVAGEVASSIMKETTLEVFAGKPAPTQTELKRLVLSCFQEANDRIHALAEDEPSYAGMGCTAVLLTFAGNSFVLGHVGDSRCYRLRQGVLEQLGKDHTFVQQQLEEGNISRDQAKKHRLRNIILRAVGIEKSLEVDCRSGKAEPGDLYLLCSDGLTDMVDDESILEIITYPCDLPFMATLLIDQANHAGGADNIAVVLVKIE